MSSTDFDAKSPSDGGSIQGEVHTLARGAVVSMVGVILGRVLNVVSQIFIARAFGPAIYGLYAIGWSILKLTGIVANLGVWRVLTLHGVRYLNIDPSRLRQLFSVLFRFSFLWSTALGLTIFFSAEWLAQDVFKSPDALISIQVFAILIPIQTLGGTLGGATYLTRDVRYSVFGVDFFQPFANLLLMVVFFQLGWGFGGALSATFISFLGSALLLAYFFYRVFGHIYQFPRAKDPSARELILSAFVSFFPGFFSSILGVLDRVVVASFVAADQVGIYQAASQFSVLFVLILGNVNAVFSPIIVSLYESQELGKLDELFKITTKWALNLALPISVVSFFAAPLVMTVIFGESYVSGAAVLQILTLGQVFNVATGAVGALLLMTGYLRSWAITSFVGVFTSVVVSVFLSPHIGIAGAALGTALGVGIQFSLGLWLVRQKLGLWPYDRRYLKSFLATCASVACVLLLLPLSFLPAFLHLLVISGVALAVFWLVLVSLGLDDADRQVLFLLRDKIFRWVNKDSTLA